MLRYALTIFFALVIFAGSAPADTVFADTVPSPVASPSAAPAPSADAERDSAAAAYKLSALSRVLSGDSAGAPAASPLTNPYQTPSLSKLALRMVVGLAVVLVLLFVLYRMARRAKGLENAGGTGSSASALQVLETRSLGGGQKIVLVRVGPSSVLAVGCGSEGMRTLAEIRGADAAAILETHRAQVIPASQFTDTVDHLLRRFKRDGGEA
jgi:flagellar biogenesis protein FliO